MEDLSRAFPKWISRAGKLLPQSLSGGECGAKQAGRQRGCVDAWMRVFPDGIFFSINDPNQIPAYITNHIQVNEGFNPPSAGGRAFFILMMVRDELDSRIPGRPPGSLRD